MREREPQVPERQLGTARNAELNLTEDDWELLRESVDEHLRSYTEANYTWWEPDDDRPVRLQALLEKFQAWPRPTEEDEPAKQP